MDFVDCFVTDLSKAFDCLQHDLLMAKLHVHGCNLPSLNSYLRSKHQRVNKNSFCSSWTENLFGFPQGSTLVPILFNIFLCDLFLFIKKNVANYVDDTTFYETGGHSAYVMHNLEVLGNTLLNWINDNSMKTNPGKYHLLLSVNGSSKITIRNKTSSSCKREKLLGIEIDYNLNFKEQIEFLCKMASQNIIALSRLALDLD